MISLLYVLLAIFGLSLLIFFHELGHYYMARRVGMRVEVFAIGFGKPIYQWERNGVKWQIGWLLFGGYVKIAGQENDDTRNPYEIPDGFFGKRPIDRIKVAVAGPFVNIVLAFLIFVILWAIGGREKKFSEYTHIVGWVDPKSELFAHGVRPGDEITAYNHQPFESAKDHTYAPMLSSGEVVVEGKKVDYATGEKKPFEYTVKTYPHPQIYDKGVSTIGILYSSNYSIYERVNGQDNPIPLGSPMQNSGIEYGDRILWVDGDLIFSGTQLSHLLNDGKVLLTIEREGKHVQVRVPRVRVEELKMTPEFKEELTDWQYEAHLKGTKTAKLFVLPYNLTNDAVVENPLTFIDKDNEQDAFTQTPFSSNEQTLQAKDKIVAVDGMPVKSSYDLLSQLQTRRVNIIVERNKALQATIPSDQADRDFDREIDWKAISKIANTIGTPRPIKNVDNYYLLNTVTPKILADFELPPEKQAMITNELLEHKKEAERIEDPEKRAHVLQTINHHEKLLLLGLPDLQDRKVNYNPTPFEQFDNVSTEIWRTLTALFTGSLNPKWISGPVGIIHVVHDNSMVSLKEALFWLGAISLNLGMLNLLPIPVLDGGTIVLSFFEMVTGRKIHPKTLEKVILPFAVLLIAFFIFLTYQDITRIFTKFIPW